MERRSEGLTVDVDDDLHRLAVQHDAKRGANFYIPHYLQRFAAFRNRKMTVLEIGVGGYEDSASGGNSLKLWRDYFPNAQILGLDYYDKHGLDGDRIHTIQGDQSDPAFLDRLGQEHGPFDIIIDDGSHRPPHIRQSFASLWTHLSADGWYVIEDMQTSYWEIFDGTSVRGVRPTTMDLLRDLIDALHHSEIDVVGYEPTELDQTIIGIDILRNIAFIRKGDNSAVDKRLGPHPRDRVVFGVEVPRQKHRVIGKLKAVVQSKR